MEDSEKLDELRAVLGPINDDDSVLLSYLIQAKEAILNRMYPYLDDDTYMELEVPRRYESKQIRIAAYLFSKRGAEGEIQHNENGTNRTYKGSDIPDDMLRDILPCIGIPR